MPIPTFTGLPPDPSFTDLAIKLNTVVKELTNLMLNLDKNNIVEVDGDVLISGTVTAGKIQVNELSAISANLGHIIAGLIESVEIYGSYIATRRDAFPRAEMSSDNNLFGAYKDQNNSITIEADYGGAPMVRFNTAGQSRGSINTLLGGLTLDGIGTLWLNSTGDIRLSPGNGVYVNWNMFRDSDGRSLRDQLLGFATRGIQTDNSNEFNGGIPIGTELMKKDGTSVVWRGIPAHTHTQK